MILCILIWKWNSENIDFVENIWMPMGSIFMTAKTISMLKTKTKTNEREVKTNGKYLFNTSWIVITFKLLHLFKVNKNAFKVLSFQWLFQKKNLWNYFAALSTSFFFH